MFIIKKSQISDAGDGLYSVNAIKKGQVISVYYGEKITMKEFQKRINDGKGRYAVGVNKRYVIDAENHNCPAKFANDAKGKVKTDFKNNASFYNFKGTMAMVADRNIKAGEEIFADYGKDYWETWNNITKK